MPAAAAFPSTYRIALPEDWVSFDVDLATIDSKTQEVARELTAAGDLGAEDIDGIAGYLRAQLVEAEAAGVVLAAGFAAVSDDDPPVPLIASMTVALVESPENEPFSPSRAADILGNQQLAPPDRVVEVVARVGWTGVLLRETKVFLPDELADDPELVADPPLVHVAQYFLPAGSAPGFGVLTFTTPSLALADDFDELFDAVASTFEFDWNGEDSSLD